VNVLVEAIDPEGRRVVLDQRVWDHMLKEHPEIGAHRASVMATITAPEHRRPDPRPGRERYWRRGLGPSRWLLVVVDFGSDPARVVTAYGNRKDPPGWTP
jgi:hypothetical protein